MATKVFMTVTNQFLQCRQPGAVVFELSCRQTDKQTNRLTGKRRAKYNLLAQVKSHITLLGFQNKTKQP